NAIGVGRSSTVAAAVSIACRSVKSHSTKNESGAELIHSLSVAVMCAERRPSSAQIWPRAANSRAQARPMPRPAPVITTTPAALFITLADVMSRSPTSFRIPQRFGLTSNRSQERPQYDHGLGQKEVHDQYRNGGNHHRFCRVVA